VRDDYDIVVVGAGVAGLTSALTAVRLGRSVLVLAGAAPGGLLLSIERIEGLPGFPEGVAGYELCPGLQAEADEGGAEVANLELDSFESSDGAWVIGTAEGAVRARAVILATGARFRRLEVPGEERLQGHGVSTCASCDGPLMNGKTAAVVGGGDSALQEALTLADSVDQVVILHRGDQLSGQASYRVRVAECATIEVRYSTIVEEILGEQTVGALRVRDLSTDAVEELQVGGVFPYVGLRPSTERFAAVVVDTDGAVLTDPALRTSAAGVFAAGIVRSGAAGRAAAASGEGAAAAVAAHAYLAEGIWPSTPPTVVESV
jgi:thioredoxin reductase (NADPH)